MLARYKTLPASRKAFAFALFFFNLCGCTPEIGIVPLETAEVPDAVVPFEPNLGQSNASARFLSRADSFTALLYPLEAGFALQLSGAERESVFAVKPVGADTSFAEPVGEFIGKRTFRGAGVSGGVLESPLFGGVRYREVFPGVDITYSSDATRLSYEVLLHPGADLSRIAFEVFGTQELVVDQNGNLVGDIAGKKVIQSAPFGIQSVQGREVVVPIRYVLDGGTVYLQSPDYDRTVALRLVPRVSTR
jgi:hypothetical protein